MSRRQTPPGRARQGRATGSRRPGPTDSPTPATELRNGPARRLGTAVVLACLVALAGLVLWRAGVFGAEPDGGSATAHGAPAAAPAGPVAAPGGGAAGPRPATGEVQRLRARVLASYPHDPTAYTQGLLLHDGSLYESTGGYGSSRLRRVELATGRVLADRELPADWFGEGLARVPAAGGGRLVQLTWREGVAQAWSLPDLERISLTHYEGEGWGLCWDDSVPLGRLVMSDGSSRLTFREPEGLAVTGGVEVTLDGRPVAYLNELECVGGRVYANVFTTDEIVEIDPRSGRVTAVVDASGLLDAGEAATAEVLNGIAWDPGDGSFLVTGKLWPRLFRVELVPAG